MPIHRRRALPSEIVLASASPRRIELLRQIGVDPHVIPAHIDESAIRSADPVRLTLALARAKAHAVGVRPGVPVLAADTVVEAGGLILEKPADRSDAERMLRLLSGSEHRVVTGVAVLRAAGELMEGHAESRVTFETLTESEIAACLDSEEWVGVAGAYRIQGVAARHITGLCGSYSNVVGLPLHLVYSILTQ